MSNLTGENLPDHVAKQIQQRQLLAGQGFNPNEKFKSEKYNLYFNSNNCFLNVVSCINLDSAKLRDKAKEAGVDYIFNGFEGNELAKSFILISLSKTFTLISSNSSSKTIWSNFTTNRS